MVGRFTSFRWTRRRSAFAVCLAVCAASSGWVSVDAGAAAGTPVLQDELLSSSDVATFFPQPRPRFLLIGIGDSLTHGTMDATNNFINTGHAYVQRIVNSLRHVSHVRFSQPYFDVHERRIFPFTVPTNLGVDGADSFSVDGLQYYKRAGVAESFVTTDYLADRFLPAFLDDKYDKVLYPINVLSRAPASQMDAASWLLSRAPTMLVDRTLVLLWIGNNDSSTAALGAGGSSPQFQPIPFDVVAPELKPGLRFLLALAEREGLVSFEPYLQSSIERNLTDLDDFTTQYESLATRLETEAALSGVATDHFLLTLPYYSSVGYLFDSEDLEFYLRKLDPSYEVPPSFERVALPGTPITDPTKGDRISLLTFGMMYALLRTGHTVEAVNRVLEVSGRQRDGLVLSEDESAFIRSRIDGFNAAIEAAAAARGSSFHVIDVGGLLNDVLTGELPIVVDGRQFSRKWVRGGGFSLDGVHPGYVGQSLIANFILEELNRDQGLDAPLYDLSSVLGLDPYIDEDGDGWAPGPGYRASGTTKLLFLFKDPDDADPAIQVALPPDVWDQISDVLLGGILGIPTVRAEAERLQLLP